MSVRHFRHGAILALSIAATGVVLTGCGSSVEDNQLFKDQQKIVARLDDDYKAMGRQVEDFGMTMETIKQDIREIKANPQAANINLKDFDQRIKTLETTVAGIQDSVKDRIMNLAKNEIKENSTKEEGEVKGADKPAEAKPASRTVQGKISKSSEKPATATLTASKGSYYVVKSGDTVEKVAAARGISAKALLDANHLPAGAKLFAGQRVFVPAS